MHSNVTFQNWIDHLRYLMPPQGVVHIGAGAGASATRYANWLVNTCVLIEAEESYYHKLTRAVSGHKGWSAHTAMVSGKEGEAVYYKVSNPGESGSLPPEVMTKLWRNLKTIEERRLITTTLEHLLTSADILPDCLNWLVIECLPALPILQGAGRYRDGLDVVMARVLLDENLYPGKGATKIELDSFLHAQGYRCIAIEEERQPALASALYIRDWKAIQNKSLESQGKIQQLMQERDEQVKVSADRQRQLDEMQKRLQQIETQNAEFAMRQTLLQEKLKADIKADISAGKPNPYGHNRTMTPALNKMLRDFAEKNLKREGLKVAYIDYLAAKAIHIERNSVGRLATTVQDSVARQLVAECVPGDRLCILEIGSLYGISLSILYNHTITRFQQVQVTGLDPFDGYYGKAIDVVFNCQINDITFQRNMQLGNVPQECYRLIKHYSTDPAAIFAAKELPINLLIIDGDHSYEGIKFDFDNYFPLLQPEGYVIFDDYNAKEWPGVQKFIDEDLSKTQDVEYLGALSRTAVARKKRAVLT